MSFHLALISTASCKKPIRSVIEDMPISIAMMVYRTRRGIDGPGRLQAQYFFL